MLKRVVLCVCLLMVMGTGFLVSQESSGVITNERALGDQSFSISVGLFIPLSTNLLNDWPDRDVVRGAFTPKLNLGGVGALSYSFYVTSNILVGLQLSGAFSNDINSNYVYPIPITVRAAWEFHIGNRFSLPLGLGLGILMSSYKTYFAVDFILKPYTGFYFDWSNEWSFGMEIDYWFIPQLSSSNSEEHSLVHFLDIRLGVNYHF